ncbi:MAG: serine kinase [Synergistaceae bacterium]|nr:serine kinase [Synergistaceae bacterium]
MPEISIQEICSLIDAKVHVPGDGSRIVSRATAGDLLSFVMGCDSAETAWVTIQTHLNIAAVAVLKEIPLIIIAAGRAPAPDLAAKCAEENITLATSGASMFDTCVSLGRLGLSG